MAFVIIQQYFFWAIQRILATRRAEKLAGSAWSCVNSGGNYTHSCTPFAWSHLVSFRPVVIVSQEEMEISAGSHLCISFFSDSQEEMLDAPELEISCSKCVRRANLANLCINAFTAMPNSTNTNGQTWTWSPKVWQGQHETRGRHIYRRVSIFHLLGWSLMMSPRSLIHKCSYL